MQISTKGRYALRFLLDVCTHQEDGKDVPLSAVAERQNISKKYLEHVVALLTPTDMLTRARGKNGGYHLAKDPSTITVAAVLRATEGSLAPVSCLEGSIKGCERRDECMTLGMWEGLGKVVTDYLEGITLQSIIDDYTPAIEYYI